MLENKVFKQAFQDKYQPRILSLVVPPNNDTPDEYGIHEVAKNTLLFSYYANAHKGICIEYKIKREFLEQGKMFYTDVQYSTDTNAKSLSEIFAIKDKKWRYESEGRFVAFGKKKIYTLNKGTTRITKIIFGIKTTEKDKALLSGLLRLQGKQQGREPQVKFFNTSNDTEGNGSYFKFDEYKKRR